MFARGCMLVDMGMRAACGLGCGFGILARSCLGLAIGHGLAWNALDVPLVLRL
jgi:hypothetical protein